MLTSTPDFDGDGKADAVVYRPSTGTWYVLWSSTNYTTSVSYGFGLAGDIPVLAPTGAPTCGTASVSIVSGASTLTTTAFSPNPLNVSIDTTVTWVNNDTVTHNLRADNGSFATGLIAPGSTPSVSLQTAGSYVYHCTIHPGMVGTIMVQ